MVTRRLLKSVIICLQTSITFHDFFIKKNGFHDCFSLEVSFSYHINCSLFSIFNQDCRYKLSSCLELTSDVSLNMREDDLTLTFDKFIAKHDRKKWVHDCLAIGVSYSYNIYYVLVFNIDRVLTYKVGHGHFGTFDVSYEMNLFV